MKKIYSKSDFVNLDFDSKCIIFESLLTDEYFQGQTDINFYFPDDSNIESGQALPETPPEIKKVENEKMELLIQKLTENLFRERDSIEFDLH